VQEDSGLLKVQASAGHADLLASPRETLSSGERHRRERVPLAHGWSPLPTRVTTPDSRSEPGLSAWESANVRCPAASGGAGGGCPLGRPAERRTFQEDDVELLTSFAQHVAIAIENARLFREKERLQL